MLHSRRVRFPIAALWVLFSATAAAQQQTTAANSPTAKIPIRQLSAPDATARDTIRYPSGLFQFSDGRVIVNDVLLRRLIVYDSTLATYRVTADSTGNPSLYPPSYGVTNIFEYLGDSALFPDMTSRVFLLIEPGGKIGRSLAHPKPRDMNAFSQPYSGAPAFDRQGRLIYRGGSASVGRPPGTPGALPPRTVDTLLLVRADFESRSIDTIAHIMYPVYTPAQISRDEKGKASARMTINPLLPPPDEWVVTSDGSVAIVKAQDYHVDWIHPDGSRTSTPKMPFDWRPLTDADKQARIDSVRHMIDSLAAAGRPYGMMITGREGEVKPDTIIPAINFAPFTEMPDYFPPFRTFSAKADRDNNVWVPPATTYANTNGGMIYDVISRNGEIFERVLIPPGRTLVGFGRGGVVYLTSGNRDTGFVLERRHILRGRS